MTKVLTEIIKTLFPDTTRRLIGLLTVFLCTVSVLAIGYLQKIGMTLPTEFLPLLLAGVAASFWLVLGLASLLVASALRNKTLLTKEAKSKKDLSSNALSVLTIFGKHGVEQFTTEYLSRTLALSFNQAQLAIDELTQFGFLSTTLLYSDDVVYWLSAKGRAFLGKEKLL